MLGLRVNGNRLKRWLLPSLMLVVMPIDCPAAELWDLPPLRYSQSRPHDPLARLMEEVKAGRKSLPVTDTKKLLLALLRELRIPVESQVLVFPKTSKQVSLISPGNPRAIYFSDNAYLAWVPGGTIEAIVHDSVLGPVFYEVVPTSDDAGIELKRSGTCLGCHVQQGGSLALTLRSTTTSLSGTPGKVVEHAVDHATPYANRWGGWYVTGRSDGMKHLGNLAGGKLLDFERQVPDGRYPHRGSDVLALMLLDHQVKMYSLFVRAKMHYQRTRWLEQALQQEDRHADKPENRASSRLASRMAEEILAALLFADEAELPGDGVEGSSAFQEAFRKKNVRGVDDEGGEVPQPANPTTHSLKDLRLYKRIFKYRCSYMIYSDGFCDLPGEIKKQVMQRLGQVLDGKDTSGKYDYLGLRERQRIREILDAGEAP